MKKFRFRILCAILSVVICLSLFTACGGGNNGGKLNDLDLRFDENGDPIFNDITLNVWSVIGLPDNVYLNRVGDYYMWRQNRTLLLKVHINLFPI